MADLIKVTFPDGEQICYKSPINTMIQVLIKIGVNRFPEITLENAKRPLVSQEIYPELKYYTREIVPGWYYINRTDTREKTAQLININRLLDLGLKIEVGEDLKAQSNPKIGRASKQKNRLRVTMANGEILDYDTYCDVFMACIDKLGPRLVSSKANFDLNGNCPLLTTTNTTGKRRKVAESLYLALPNTVKDACKMLRLITSRLGLLDKMKIEVIPLASPKNVNC